jgi:hypothetical protein
MAHHGKTIALAVEIDDPIVAEKTAELDGQLGGHVGVRDTRRRHDLTAIAAEVAEPARVGDDELAVRFELIEGSRARAIGLRDAG